MGISPLRANLANFSPLIRGLAEAAAILLESVRWRNTRAAVHFVQNLHLECLGWCGGAVKCSLSSELRHFDEPKRSHQVRESFDGEVN
jgi:hypothetical protein